MNPIRRSLFPAIALLFLSGTLCSQTMEEEPNDEITQAQLIPLNETVIATWGSNFEWDFFRYEVTQYGKLTFDVVNTDKLPLSLDIVVMSESPTENLGNSIEEINSGSPQVHIEKCCLAPGTYYVRLRAPNNVDNEEYYLESIFTPYDGPQDEAQHQTNDTALEADPITLDAAFQLAGITGQDTYFNDTKRDGVDWFEFNLGARGDIIIDSLDFAAEYDATCSSWDVSPPGYRIYLDPGNTGQGAGQVNDGFETRCIAPGAHYIRVLDPSFAAIDEYCRSYVYYGHLELQEGGDDGELDNEDDGWEDAREIELGDDTAELIGHLGYKFFDGIPVADTEDWWKITTPSNGEFSAGIEWDPEVLNPAIDFFAPDGSNLPFSTTSQSGEGFKQRNLACLEAGLEILIRIKNFGGTCGQYTLYFPDPTGDGIPTSDDNDTVETADEIDLTSNVPVSIGMRGYDENYDDVTDEKDYFKFTLQDGGFSVFFQDAGELPDYQLYLYDLFSDEEDLTAVLPGIAATSVFEEQTFVTYECLGAGEYILELSPGSLGCDAFTLSLSQSSTGTADEEPEPEEGVMMEGNTQEGTLGHDVDFVFGETGNFLVPDYSDKWLYVFEAPGDFYVDLTSGQQLFFDVSVKSSSGLELTQYGEVVTDFPTHYRWEVSCLGADTLTIEVGLGDGGNCGAYTLEVGESAVSGDEVEPNDSLEDATTIDTGAAVTGYLGHLNASDFETVDWRDYYAFEWTTGDIEVLVSNPEGIFPELSLHVLSLEGNAEIEASEVTEEGDAIIHTYACLGEGTYYVQLNAEGVNGFDCRQYLMSISGEESEFNDDEQLEPKPATIGEAKKGNIGSSNANGDFDGQDTYAYALDEGGTLRLTIDSEADFSPMSLVASLLVRADFAGAPIAPFSISGGEDGMYLDFPCYGADSAYVTLEPLTTECISYTLTASFINVLEYDQDEEPNNNISGAMVIDATDEVEGWLLMEEVVDVLDPEFSSLDEGDYYRFELEENTSLLNVVVNRDFQNGETNGTVNLVLLQEQEEGDPSFLLPLSAEDVGDTRVAEYGCLSSGTYYLGVLSTGQCGSYRLTLDAISAGNDTFGTLPATATEITSGEEISDALGYVHEDVVNYNDFFKITIPFSSRYSFDFHPSGGIGVIDIHYFGSDGTEDMGSTSYEYLEDGAEVSKTYNCPKPGVYVIHVYGSAEASCMTYEFSMEYTPAEQDDFELNDTAADAALLLAESSIEANVGYYYDPFAKDQADYFSVSTPAGEGQEVTISTVTLPDGNISSRMIEVLGPGTAYTSEALSSSDFTHTIPASGVDQDVIFKVRSGGGCGSYSVTTANVFSLPGDFNGDGVLTASDLTAMLSSYGCTTDCGLADLNGDGVVNGSDLLIWLGLFGSVL